MSTLTVTVAGSAIDYGEVELTRGTSDALPAPEATVTGAVGEFTAGDAVTIETDTETLFTGQVARPRIRRGGRRDLTCEHDLAPLFEESVDVPPTTSVTTALESAVTNASTSATVQFEGADVTLGEQYAADGRSVRRIFADLTERTGRVWRVVDPDTIVVEPLGANGTISVDTATADAAVREFDPGDARTVINDVTVNGTGGERVVGTASDATSISEYGTRSQTTNVNYIETQSEADAYADALLRPDPLASATVIVGARSLDVVSQQANATLTLTDPSRGIDGVELVVEEQTNTSGGSAVLKVGEGAASSLVTDNRKKRSIDDKFEGDDLEKIAGTLDDVEDGTDFGKILQTAIDNGRHTLSAAVGDLDNIDDGGTFARVREGNVDSDNFVLLATSVGDLDDIDDGSQYGRVLTTGIDAGNIVLAEAVGDLDDIEDGSSFGKVEITNLTPGGAVFATGVELDDSRDLGSITATDAAKSRTVIDGGEILSDSITVDEIDANTITADEIDTLDLDTNQLTIGDPGTTASIEFEVDGGVIRMIPDGSIAIGSQTLAYSFGAFQTMNIQTATPTQGDDTGFIGSGGSAYSEMNAYDFIVQPGDTSIADGGNPLAGVAEGEGPPDTCERCDDETGETKGYSVNQMTREAWDVIRAQQRRIEDLEARLAALEGDTDPNA